MKQLSLFFVFLFLLGCHHSNSTYLAKNLKFKIPSSDVLGHPKSFTQLLEFHGKENLSLLAKIEVKQNCLTIVGLTTTYQKIFHIQQIQNHIEYQSIKTINKHFKPKIILALFYLTQLDTQKIKSYLPPKAKLQVKDNVTTFQNKNDFITITTQITNKNIHCLQISSFPMLINVKKLEEIMP